MIARIQWNTWSKEAFVESQKKNKPVLLALSAVWCHWCHVMDETTYSDQDSIELIMREVIPVRVDIDEHPEIKERYHLGGFPTTVFLNADGKIISGGTYLPPVEFKHLLKRACADFDNQKQ